MNHHRATRECCCIPGGDDCCSSSSGLYIDGTYANETLPYEVLLHIFGHLSMKELGVVCVVCKFWKEASEADCLWKSITLSLWGGLGLRDVQRAAAATTTSTSTTTKDTGARSSSSSSSVASTTTTTSSSSSCPSSPSSSSSSALRPASSPFSSPKPSRRRGLLGLLSGSGSGFHTSGGDEIGSGGSDEAQATSDKGAKSRSSSVELQHHNSGNGASAEAQADSAAASTSASDYLSSFSTLKDLYRHEFERRQRRGEDEYRIVVVGASGVDKSAICVRFVQGSLMLTKYDPTAEESYRVRRKVDGLPCMYDIMDTAGQMEYSALRDQYLKSGHGFLLVYSVTSPESFQALEKLRLQILRIKEDSTVPIVFLGSHADRESQRQVSQDEALFLAEKLNCGWLECSAKTGQNVNDAFELIVRMINRWRALHPAWNTPKSRQEATIKNRVKKKILFWRENNRT